MIFVFYLSYVETNRELQKARDSVSNLAQLSAANLSRILGESQAFMTALGTRTSMRALDRDQCDPYLDDFARTFASQYSGIGLVDDEGHVLCTSSANPDIPPAVAIEERSWFSEVINKNHFSVGNVQTGPLSGRWIAVLAQPIGGDDGEPDGALLMPLDLVHYQRSLEELQLPEGAVITVVDAAGIILADSNSQLVGREIGDSASLTLSPASENQLVEAEGSDGISRLYAVATVPDTNWLVYAGVPTEEVLAPVRTAVWRYAFLAVAVLLLILALVLYVRFQLEQPLRHLKGVATAVAAGDSTVRAASHGPAEVREVAAQFNNMLDVRHHLYQEEQQARRTADGLRRATLALSETLNLSVVVERLLEAAADLVPYDSANVLLLSDKDELKVYALRGYEPDKIDSLKGHVFEVKTKPHLQQVVRERRGLIVNDVQEQDGWQPLAGTEHVRSWLAVPLLFEGKLLGILSVDSVHPGFYGRHHLHLLEVLGAAASVAIHHARIFADLRASQEKLSQLTHQLIHAQEAERQRLSQALHDDAGQMLTALQLMLGMVRSKLPDEYPQLQKMVSEAADMSGETMEHLRALSEDLRAPAFERASLAEILDHLCRDFSHRTGLDVDCRSTDVPSLPEDVPLSLYRFAQEALANVADHANARQVRVSLEQEKGEVLLSISDDGEGFDVAAVAADANDSNVGLGGMHERLQLLGGRLEVHSQPGDGTTLTARIPIQINGTAS